MEHPRNNSLRAGDKRLTRRQFLERSAAIGVGFALAPSLIAACGGEEAPDTGSPASAPVTLTFVSYGGGYQEAQVKAWLDPYVAANPHVTIVQDSPSDYAKLKAMVESGNVTWDVVDIGNDFGLPPDAPDYLEPIDKSVVTAWATPLSGVQNSDWRVGEQTASYMIAYRTDIVDTPVRDWADFYDLEKIPGKRCHWKYVAGGVLESALLADGLTQEELYPLDLDRAFAKLDTIKDELVWWESGAQAMQLLGDGEVAVGALWTGRAYDLQREGKPVELAWGQHLMFTEYFAVPKGSRNVAEAMKLIAYMTSVEHNAELSYHWVVGPATEGAMDNVDPESKDFISASHLDQAVFFDDQYYAQDFDAADEAFQSWLQS